MILDKKRYLLMICCIMIAHNSTATSLIGTSFLSPRSQSTNTARTLIGEHRFEHLNEDRVTGVGSATFEYTHSYQPRRIAQYFFGTNMLIIAGSAVPDRSEEDILADYF